MEAALKPRTPFGDKLRKELDRQNLSIRALGRRLDPKNPEQARRTLSRWISGETKQPTRASRALLADALGVDRSFFDEDDEEDDQEMHLIVSVLMHRIDEVVAKQIDARLGEHR